MMISKAQIKHVSSLKLLKFRKAKAEFVIEGEKMLHELLMSNYQIKTVYALPEWLGANTGLIASRNIDAEKVTQKELERISSFKTPNQVLAVVTIPKQNSQNINFDDLILVLDDIQDPGNLGTMIRTAEWFGVEQIICSMDTVDVFNSKVIQSTMGSVFRAKIHYTDLAKFFAEKLLENIPVYGALLNGKNLYEQKLTKNGILVIGNESKGISKEITKFITNPISIPAHANSSAESLNASVAAAVLMNEFRKQ